MWQTSRQVSPTVIDHGMASVELLLDEALQDIPPLVKDIQERLRRTSQQTTVCE